MYTSRLISVIPDPNFPEISVSTIQFYKDDKEFGLPDIERGLTKVGLSIYCKNKINSFVQSDTQKADMAALIQNPPLGDIDLSDPVTPEIVENTRVTKLRGLKERLDVKDIDQLTYDASVAAIKADVK